MTEPTELKPNQWKIVAHSNAFEGYKVRTIPLDKIRIWLWGFFCGVIFTVLLLFSAKAGYANDRWDAYMRYVNRQSSDLSSYEQYRNDIRMIEKQEQLEREINRLKQNNSSVYPAPPANNFGTDNQLRTNQYGLPTYELPR